MVSLGAVLSMYFFFRRADSLVSGPTELARISSEMNQVHQYIANFVNYDDPSYLALYRAELDDLTQRLERFDPTAREISRRRNDVEFIYAYLEIQNQLAWYREDSELLIQRIMDGNEERFVRFDRLYNLRDLKGRITAALSDLLFRQMTHTQETYDSYRRSLRYQSIIFFVFIAVAVLWLVRFVARQAREISLPIGHLVEQGRRIAAHNYEISSLPRVGNDELQTLNDTFKDMAAEIARSIEVLSQNNALERSNLEMEQSLKQAELELLQSQINPHFLFNTLNTISSLAQIEDAQETVRLLASFSTFLRFNLRSMNSIVTVQRELEIVESYLFIQKQRFGDRLRYYIDADDGVLDERIPSLTIQPLVENALIHGIEPKREGGSVVILVTEQSDKSYLLTVCDSGLGMPQTTVKNLEERIRSIDNERDHLGIANTVRRIRLYDPDARLQIDTAPDCGTQVSVRIHPHAEKSLTKAG